MNVCHVYKYVMFFLFCAIIKRRAYIRKIVSCGQIAKKPGSAQSAQTSPTLVTEYGTNLLF